MLAPALRPKVAANTVLTLLPRRHARFAYASSGQCDGADAIIWKMFKSTTAGNTLTFLLCQAPGPTQSAQFFRSWWNSQSWV